LEQLDKPYSPPEQATLFPASSQNQTQALPIPKQNDRSELPGDSSRPDSAREAFPAEPALSEPVTQNRQRE